MIFFNKIIDRIVNDDNSIVIVLVFYKYVILMDWNLLLMKYEGFEILL